MLRTIAIAAGTIVALSGTLSTTGCVVRTRTREPAYEERRGDRHEERREEKREDRREKHEEREEEHH